MKFSKFTTLGAAAVLSMAVLAQGILAVGPYDSEATVSFTEDIQAPGILDPTDPSTPFVPGVNGNPVDPPTGDAGPLSLDYVSSLDFGSQNISMAEETYEALSLKPFIQVTDKRATSDGWNVTLSATEFTDGANSLNGATLNFRNGEAVSNNSFSPPTPAIVELTTDGTTVGVVSAAPDEGRGSWITRWFPTNAGATTNDSVTLTVPGGIAKEAAYASTLTWTLTNTP